MKKADFGQCVSVAVESYPGRIFGMGSNALIIVLVQNLNGHVLAHSTEKNFLRVLLNGSFEQLVCLPQSGV